MLTKYFHMTWSSIVSLISFVLSSPVQSALMFSMYVVLGLPCFGWPCWGSLSNTFEVVSSLWWAHWQTHLNLCAWKLFYWLLGGSHVVRGCSYVVASAHSGPFTLFIDTSPASLSGSTFPFHRVRQTPQLLEIVWSLWLVVALRSIRFSFCCKLSKLKPFWTCSHVLSHCSMNPGI